MAYTLHCERATLDFDLARGAEAMHVIPMGQAPQVVKQDAPDGYVGEDPLRRRLRPLRQAPNHGHRPGRCLRPRDSAKRKRNRFAPASWL